MEVQILRGAIVSESTQKYAYNVKCQYTVASKTKGLNFKT